ncbi:GNAT family N-acetyltransferase [Flavobacterium cyanobacteriorum]|uniref:GNAT family N-acetyltransferase n=1 Tax=Flavobacterium cyanobacteriorum TaxID=2022802 RepID=A0A255YX81_9FLAO|nr:GNAT family N-acetyltransferase [Flavobacterium cyanobacteriorum]OYQ33020.1 GNAT family N-acetyltransferase [Flavobacterium cyanobacteriorum]
MYSIVKYSPEYYSQWNAFVEASKNGTFLFHRDFMEYHSDRFEDFSLLIFEGAKLLAVLPANKVGDEVHSHGGLTYGGLVYNDKVKLAQVIRILRALLKYLHDAGFLKLYVKIIPPIYHKIPAQEIDYALFVAGAALIKKDSLSVYDPTTGTTFSKDRKQCINRGIKNNLKIVEEPEFDLFWNTVLIPNLKNKHGVMPVHSAGEITLLHSRFPENIRQFNLYHEGKIVAGTTIFVTDMVAHPQYISGNADKNKLGSLDYLYHYFITEIFRDKRYFDFGPSNLEHGKKLNENLVFWKESFGARTVTQDFYEVETKNYKLLDKVLF